MLVTVSIPVFVTVVGSPGNVTVVAGMVLYMVDIYVVVVVVVMTEVTTDVTVSETVVV